VLLQATAILQRRKEIYDQQWRALGYLSNCPLSRSLSRVFRIKFNETRKMRIDAGRKNKHEPEDLP
jgi:hypothetical protein